MRTLYSVLEIGPTASKELIDISYEIVLRKCHSAGYENKDLEEKISRINRAYEILSDEKKKRKYDLLIGNADVQYDAPPSTNIACPDAPKEEMIKKTKGSGSKKLILFFVCFFSVIALIFYQGYSTNLSKDVGMNPDYYYNSETISEMISENNEDRAIYAAYTKFNDDITEWIKTETVVHVYGWGGKQVEPNVFYVEYAFDEKNSNYNDGYVMYCFECINSSEGWSVSFIGNSGQLYNKYKSLGYVN